VDTDGSGAISKKSGMLDKYPYLFASRFERKRGANPDELIGTAHTGCFTMALSLILGEARLKAEHMETKAEVTLDKVQDGFATTAVSSDPHRQDPGRRPGEVRGTCRQGEGGLSRFQALERRDHFGCGAGVLTRTSRARSDSQ
jgi:OsmC subfamily peroxiredoxin